MRMVGEGLPCRFLHHSGLYLVWRGVVAVSKGARAARRWSDRGGRGGNGTRRF